MVTAICKIWHDDGWGVLVSEVVPGEIFAHFSRIDGGGYKEVLPGEKVQIDWEAFPEGQDGCCFRATRVVRKSPE